jgi:hypothetical protein
VADAERERYNWAGTDFIVQNGYLYCASAGLATVVRASIDREVLAEAMALRPEQHIIVELTVGYPGGRKRGRALGQYGGRPFDRPLYLGCLRLPIHGWGPVEHTPSGGLTAGGSRGGSGVQGGSRSASRWCWRRRRLGSATRPKMRVSKDIVIPPSVERYVIRRLSCRDANLTRHRSPDCRLTLRPSPFTVHASGSVSPARALPKLTATS